MSKSFLERIASHIAMLDYPGEAFADLPDAAQGVALDCAAAIMLEARSPTQGMIKAGSDAASSVSIRNTVETAWRAMCDEAIAEHNRSRSANPEGERSVENLIRNILAGLDRKGAVGVSLDRAALEAMLDPSTPQINVEFIGGEKS